MSRNEKNCITEKLNIEKSTAIKGVALLLMLVHHLYGFPEWYVESVEYSKTILGIEYNPILVNATKICVSMFAFLTGWAYFYKKDKTLKYSLEKITNFLYKYWIILFLIFIPAAYLCSGKRYSLQIIFLNLFALDQCIVSFAWYVYFYVFCMLSLPYWTKLFNGTILNDLFWSIVPYAFFYMCIHKFNIEPGWIGIDLKNYLFWMPVVLVGFLSAKYRLFDFLGKFLIPKRSIFWFLFILICRGRWQSTLGWHINLDVLYVPLMMYCLVIGLEKIPSILEKFLLFCGRHSLNVWFLHSIFFYKYTKEVFQPIAYALRNPILVILEVLGLCCIVSYILFYVEEMLTRIYLNLKNILIDKGDKPCKK